MIRFGEERKSFFRAFEGAVFRGFIKSGECGIIEIS